jgi:hypothetical protein
VGSRDVEITLLKEKGDLMWAMGRDHGRGAFNLKGER